LWLSIQLVFKDEYFLFFLLWQSLLSLWYRKINQRNSCFKKLFWKFHPSSTINNSRFFQVVDNSLAFQHRMTNFMFLIYFLMTSRGKIIISVSKDIILLFSPYTYRATLLFWPYMREVLTPNFLGPCSTEPSSKTKIWIKIKSPKLFC